MRGAGLALLALAAAAAAVPGCATRLSEGDAQARAEDAIRRSFTHGNRPMAARVERQDEVQKLCSAYRNAPPKGIAERIEKSQMAAIRYPASGKLMGDWRQGEKIAQNGYGLRFTDPDTKRPNGGSCYNCHQLAPQEISFGTLGPSLQRFGRQRGTGEVAQRYAYGKIYNSQAFSACSSMPRFGHNGVLNEAQIGHLVALLLDPDSPVNK
ncbi:MAG: sulfur oxidation c-type cytochrome SoxX [Burkholderiales bacterium]